MVHTAAQVSGHAPPEPAEDDSVVEMIGKYFLQLASAGREASAARRGSVESCDEKESNTPVANMDAGLEPGEWLLQRDVTRQIELCLTEAKASALHCRMLLLPRQMTARVGRDVVRSSADEPCGLRGASIKVYVDCKDGLTPAGGVLLDPSVTPTFELSVIFRAERDDGWPALTSMFDSHKVLKLRPEYRLVKRKLYSSASPVIHDFS
ncbi:DNA damage-inducible transcript 4-like protein [Liparis tanakae]|uniref:DNA damage-inducible transcript 4-like protein n=1 Tax=Liparis tanakae TaxID=230148 RepID=A0A4Z2HIF3_9TELE|nr:DNA damage-inducible transcript 4-like protein [Liparis tanakae]